MNFFAYCRVSSRDQTEGYSLPAQLELLRDYAKKNSIHIAREFVEAESAKETGRPKFNEMMALLEADKTIRGVLVEKGDRFSRNYRDWALAEDLVDAGKEFHFVLDRKVYDRDSTPDDIFVYDIGLGLSRRFIRNLRRETKKGMRQKALSGIYPSHAPIGYLNQDKNIVADPKTAPSVIRLFEEFSTGRHSLGSLSALAQETGLKSRKGNRLHKMPILRILTNPVYVGRIKWDDIDCEGSHESLVSRATFDAVHEVLERGARPKKSKHAFPLRGLLVCGECGASVTAERQKGHVYYRCTKRKGSCSQRYVREEVLAAEFSRILGLINFDKDILELAVKAAKELAKSEIEREEMLRRGFAKEQGRITKTLDALTDKFVSGDVPDDIYQRRLADLRGQETAITLSLNAAGEQKWEMFEPLEKIVNVATICRDIFDKGNWADKRGLVEIIGSNWILEDGRIKRYELKEPFRSLARISSAPKRASGSPSGTVLELCRAVAVANLNMDTVARLLAA